LRKRKGSREEGGSSSGEKRGVVGSPEGADWGKKGAESIRKRKRDLEKERSLSGGWVKE